MSRVYVSMSVRGHPVFILLCTAHLSASFARICLRHAGMRQGIHRQEHSLPTWARAFLRKMV